MREKVMEIILKSLLVIAILSLVLVIPSGIFLPYVIQNEETVVAIGYALLGTFFGFSILFVILASIFGGIRQKPIEAEKFQLKFKDYDSVKTFLENKLVTRGYKKYPVQSVETETEILVYFRKKNYKELDCFAQIRIKEMSDEVITKTSNHLSKTLYKYYNGKTIGDCVNVISIFCVDRITPAFRNLVNGNIQQGVKIGRLPVGISFGSNMIYLARQKNGFAPLRYKRLRKEFISIFDLNT